ncbi:MAG: transcriptional regulator [Candidatus Baltobacteraceae bacterium]
MAKSFEALREKMTAEQRKRSDARLREMRSQVRLQELRVARAQTQESIGDIMRVPQSSVCKIEQRTDAYVSTIRRYLEAMGATLQIVARFPDGESFEITQFHDIGEPIAEPMNARRLARRSRVKA